MKIINKYILKEMIIPFLGGLGVIVFVILLSHILKILSRIIEKKVPLLYFFKLIAYNMAWILALAIPMACLIAALIAFGRLSQDMEIVAFKSSGITIFKLMIPALFLGAVFFGFMVYFNEYVLPETNYKASSLARDIRRKKPLAVITDKVFITDFPNIGLWVEEIDYEDNTLKNITAYLRSDKSDGENTVITAPTGHMDYDSVYDAVTFSFFNGEMHNYDSDSPERYSRTKFKKQVIRFDDLGTQLEESDKKGRSDREMTTKEMIYRIQETEIRIFESKYKVKEEIDKRIDWVMNPATDTEDKSYRYGKNDPLRKAFLKDSRVQNLIKQEAFLQKSLRRSQRKYAVEIHKKMSLAFACIMFIFVGAPIGVLARRGGMGTAIGFGMFFFLIFWVFLIGGEELADRGFVEPSLAMWSPNIVLFIIGCYVLYRVVYDARPGFGIFNKLLFKERKKDE